MTTSTPSPHATIAVSHIVTECYLMPARADDAIRFVQEAIDAARVEWEREKAIVEEKQSDGL